MAENIFNIEELAKYIVNRCIKLNKPITNWGLQGLLWAIQVNFIASGRCAFDEDFVIWQHINAVPIIFYDYNIRYGLKPINKLQDVGDDFFVPYKEFIDCHIDNYYLHHNEINYSDLPLWHTIRNKYKINDRITTDVFISEINHYLQSEIYNYFQKGGVNKCCQLLLVF